MDTKQRTDLNIPTRRAPSVPITTSKAANFSNGWNGSYNSGAHFKMSISMEGNWPNPEKKKPPPRPPPPKFTIKNTTKVPSRPTNLLTGLFSRSTQSPNPWGSNVDFQFVENQRDQSPDVSVTPLISFDTPPSSPTPTTRSSSDGVSVNSFGSDGNTSTNGICSAGSSSQFESGFEDDFDVFSSFSSSKSNFSDKRNQWNSGCAQDPFSPPRKNVTTQDSEPCSNKSISPETKQKIRIPSSFKPTIIKAKNSKPLVPCKPVQLQRNITSSNTNVISVNRNVYTPNYDFEEDNYDWSPPMPNIPPPAPPLEALMTPPVPPRPVQTKSSAIQSVPYGIALYDFSQTHPDDLSFKCNDAITLIREVNSEWIYGRLGHKEGIFPANYINVVIPLSNSKCPEEGYSAIVLYNFPAETWDDLELKEGETVTILSRVNKDWLYGSCNGKSGQFPSSYINEIPADLPPHTS